MQAVVAPCECLGVLPLEGPNGHFFCAYLHALQTLESLLSVLQACVVGEANAAWLILLMLHLAIQDMAKEAAGIEQTSRELRTKLPPLPRELPK